MLVTLWPNDAQFLYTNCNFFHNLCDINYTVSKKIALYRTPPQNTLGKQKSVQVYFYFITLGVHTVLGSCLRSNA